jgi:hypothetical protein
MDAPSNDRKTWPHSLVLAAVTGLVSGAVRTLITWALNH